MTTTYEEEDNSSASSDQQKSNDSRRKRKATEDMSDEEKKEAAVKRLKNREAAKKCREKKIQETENLKKKNEELEKENCELVRQRDELRQRCNALEEKLRQHKVDGCMISGFSSPYSDLSHILDPTTPPSPSFTGSHSPCSSPASSVSPAPASLSAYTLETYENDPTPMNYMDDSTRKVHGSLGNRVTNQMNSQVTLTEMREVQGGSVAMPSTSQQTPGSIQDRHQVYPYCVREKAMCPTHVQQARDEYLRRVAKMQASKTASTKSQQPNDVSAPASVSSPYLISSTSQISQGILPEPVLGVDQTANSQLKAKVSMQNYMPHDWMPFAGLGNDFRLVNPNDVFTKSEGMDEYDQSGLGQSEVEAVAIQPKEADMTDNDDQTFGQMFLEQMEVIGPELDILTNPVEQTVLHFQNESVSNLGNDKTLTVTVTNPQMTRALEHTSVVHYKEPGKLALSLGSEGTVEEPMSSQTGQAVPHTTSTADSANPPPSGLELPIVIYIDDPQDLKKPISTFPANTDFGGFSEDQQLSFDSITDMKTIKLRPKALKSGCRIPAESKPQLITRRNAAMSTQSHWDGRTTSSVISNSSFRPPKDSHTSNPSGTIGFQQESVSRLPTYQNIIAPNSVLQLAQQQPQVSQIPTIPHFSRSKAPQTIQIKAKASNQVEEQTLLMTENSHDMVDFLEDLGMGYTSMFSNV